MVIYYDQATSYTINGTKITQIPITPTQHVINHFNFHRDKFGGTTVTMTGHYRYIKYNKDGDDHRILYQHQPFLDLETTILQVQEMILESDNPLFKGKDIITPIRDFPILCYNNKLHDCVKQFCDRYTKKSSVVLNKEDHEKKDSVYHCIMCKMEDINHVYMHGNKYSFLNNAKDGCSIICIVDGIYVHKSISVKVTPMYYISPFTKNFQETTLYLTEDIVYQTEPFKSKYIVCQVDENPDMKRLMESYPTSKWYPHNNKFTIYCSNLSNDDAKKITKGILRCIVHIVYQDEKHITTIYRMHLYAITF